MNSSSTKQDLSHVLDVTNLSNEEKVALFSEVGSTVLESAMARLISELNEEQAAALEVYAETNPEPETLLRHLLDHYKNFATILEEEAQALREQMTEVLGGLDTNR